MKINYKTTLLCAIGSLLLVGYGPTKQESKPSVQKETHDTSLMYPIDLGKKTREKLTPEQQDQLEINEDNVMNPFPGVD